MRYDTNDRARSEEMEHFDSLLEENASLRAEVERLKQANRDHDLALEIRTSQAVEILQGKIASLNEEVERLKAQPRLPPDLVERLRTAVEFDLQEQFGGDLVKRLIEDVLAWHEGRSDE